MSLILHPSLGTNSLFVHFVVVPKHVENESTFINRFFLQ
jgi:hypothetical protein